MLFADDILLHKETQYQNNFAALQMSLDKISEWLYSCHIKLNLSKCKYLIIFHKRCVSRTLNGLVLNGISLECVPELWQTEKLSWLHHIAAILKRASRQAGMIYKSIYPYCSSETILQLYTTFVCLLLDHVPKVWDIYHSSHCQT